MSISVLIATYNRAALLEKCLAQLARQAYEPGDEVVVIDNGSTDDTASVVQAAATGFPVPLSYEMEATPGKTYALALGVARSRGEVLALTDDDVIVDRDWIATIRRMWREEEFGVVGGRVEPLWERPAPSWLRAESGRGYGRLAAPLALLDYGPDRVPLGTRTVLGANMAVSRRALLACGGIPLELGKLRGTLLSGEDRSICERVQAAGFRTVYDPRMAVRHCVPAERLRLRYHVRWFFWSGVTNAALASQPTGASVRVRSRHWLGRIAKGTARAAASGISMRGRSSVDALVDVAFSLGYLAFSRGWLRPRPVEAHASGGRLEAA